MTFIIRGYEPKDLEACRGLWQDLTQKHRDLYEDQTIGGDDPGKYFDEHLEITGADNIWVAEKDEMVVGLTGMRKDLDDGWEIEPVMVRPDVQGQGIGRALIEKMIEVAREREVKFLSIRPVYRNEEAIAVFHKMGFINLGHVELFMQLDGDTARWKPGAKLHDKEFSY